MQPVHKYTMEGFSISMITIRFILVAMNLSGNTLVLLTIFKTRSLQGPTTYLLSNLAATDLVFGIIIAKQYQEFQLHEKEDEDEIDPSRKWKQKLEFYTRALSSSWTLVAIAIERYLAVMKPFYHRVHVTKRRLCRIILILWLFVCLFVVAGWPLALLYQKDSPLQTNTTSNFTMNITVARRFMLSYSLSDSGNYLILGYEAFLIILCTALPAFFMGYFYGRIIYSVWFKPVTQQGTNTGILKARRKLTKLLLTVTVVFYLCWMPLFVILSDQITEKAKMVCVLFPVLSTAINPIIYSLHSKPFRQGIKSLFTCCCRKKGVTVEKSGDRDVYEKKHGKKGCCCYSSWTVNERTIESGLENVGTSSSRENPRSKEGQTNLTMLNI